MSAAARRAPSAARGRRAALAALAAALLTTGCGAGGALLETGAAPAASASGPAATSNGSGTATAAEAGAQAPASSSPAGTALIAAPRGSVLAVAASPRSPNTSPLPARTDEGSPRVLLVTQDRGDWLEVALPGRPNGRRGWVRAEEVDLRATDWRLEVSLSAHRLRVFRGMLQVAEHPVGVGKAVTPTPLGTYYVTDLLRPPDPAGPYGPYAFGLSAYSDVLTSFAGGKGQIGLHGTNEAAGIGKDVSAGCLRVADDVVRELAGQLPLGTPVVIRA